ncbi:unnamed protein product [Durusdinium trenchii]|uniref:C3H1-type domain-containing protein n=1 Tax=Durusdinium trenchii TaxID=1381693 RepID=A0ABP0HP84_9DINO
MTGPSPIGPKKMEVQMDSKDTQWCAAFTRARLEACELLLPNWRPLAELSSHRAILQGFHTQPCVEFQKGYCALHRVRGKTSLCFCFHFDSQRRRPPVTPGGRLRYWDMACQSMTSASVCPDGDDCVFAHSRDEISYHPAKYKTRRCNGKGCRGQEICCFAHEEDELRAWAPETYSYWLLVYGGTGEVEDPQRSLARRKVRFCASFPNVSQCRRGASCEFAHSREEAQTELLSEAQEQQAPEELTEDFFMYQYKTLWCPIGVQHDWQNCVYAHNYQDARRKLSIGYGPQPCPHWAKKDPSLDYEQRCPQGLRCPYAHGAKEQLYHPRYFRTVVCRDLRSKACPRDRLCAFFHRRAERRRPPPDDTDYTRPLPNEAICEEWRANFQRPPFSDLAPTGRLEAKPLPAGSVPPGSLHSLRLCRLTLHPSDLVLHTHRLCPEPETGLNYLQDFTMAPFMRNWHALRVPLSFSDL